MFAKTAQRPHEWVTDSEVPLGINTAIGAVAVTVAIIGCSLLPAQDLGVKTAALSVVLAGLAAVAVDLRSTAIVLVIAWLLLDGFVVNQAGQLSWHGTADLWRLSLLALGSALGLALGWGHRWALREPPESDDFR
jgi:hypothetical protein